MLCIEFELESGAAGAVVDESEGALGDVDCCFEQATIASALRHNKRRLRFIKITSLYICLSDYRAAGARRPRHIAGTRWNTTPGRKQRSATAFFLPGKPEATATSRAPDMLRALAVL